MYLAASVRQSRCNRPLKRDFKGLLSLVGLNVDALILKLLSWACFTLSAPVIACPFALDTLNSQPASGHNIPSQDALMVAILLGRQEYDGARELQPTGPAYVYLMLCHA